jgi:hypothetical protein
MVGPGGKSFRKGSEEAFPGDVSKGFVEEGNTQIFGQKGASSETQDLINVELYWHWGVEEEDLGFVLVNIHSRGLTKGLNNGEDCLGLLDHGGSHH